MSRALIALIKAYQYLVSPMIGSRCCFYPSCSAYAHQAIEERGALEGIFLSLKRLGRCHPWCEGGYDPLPKK